MRWSTISPRVTRIRARSNWYYSQPDRLAQAEALVIEDNVVEWVLGAAKTVDSPVSFDELMGNATESQG